ncbi:MAG: type II toxin-antitoxin system RelE/ParE family toxin [Bacteroidia bacterium]
MKIFFTQLAKEKLKEIYLFYKRTASVSSAKSIKKKILSDIKKLSKNPRIGNEEDALKYLKLSYRKLISGNYKIIYRIIENQIIIDTIFDSRQEPEKLKKI